MAFLTIVPPAQEPVSVAELANFGRIPSGALNADTALLGVLITAAREWCEAFCERAFIFQTKRLLMDFFPGYVDFKMAGARVSSPFVSGSNAVLVGIRYAIVLPWPIAREIVAFQYQDQNGNVQALTAGTNYTADLDSKPARLTPLFGQMWPVARVVVNAVQVDFVCGSAGMITVGMTASSAVVASSFNFLPRDVGVTITIPGAGAAGVDLTTTIASVSSGTATLATAASTTVSGKTIFFGSLPMAVKTAIMMLALNWYENRIPDPNDIPFGIKALLYPHRDLRF